MQDIKTNKKIYRVSASVYFQYIENCTTTVNIDIELNDDERIEDYLENGYADDEISREFFKEDGVEFPNAEISEIEITDWVEVGDLSPAEVMRRVGNKTLFDVDA